MVYLPNVSSYAALNSAFAAHHGTLSHTRGRNNWYGSQTGVEVLVVVVRGEEEGCSPGAVVGARHPVCDTESAAASATHKGTGVSLALTLLAPTLPAPQLK